MLILYFLLSISTAVNYIESLECGLDSGLNMTELNLVFNSCLYKPKDTSKNTKTDKNNSRNKTFNEDYDNNYYDDEEDVSLNVNDDDWMDDTISTTKALNVSTSRLNTTSIKSNFSSSNNYSKVEAPGRCIFHCFFKKLKIVDQNGFPDHDQVSRDILTNTKIEQVRDFFQDSVDECFQFTQQGDNLLDVCDFSLNFFKCLAEKARSNCSDFPVGETSFSNLF